VLSENFYSLWLAANGAPYAAGHGLAIWHIDDAILST